MRTKIMQTNYNGTSIDKEELLFLPERWDKKLELAPDSTFIVQVIEVGRIKKYRLATDEDRAGPKPDCAEIWGNTSNQWLPWHSKDWLNGELYRLPADWKPEPEMPPCWDCGGETRVVQGIHDSWWVRCATEEYHTRGAFCPTKAEAIAAYPVREAK